MPLERCLDKLRRVLDARRDMLVVARTDAVEEAELLLRAEALAAGGADIVLVDGVRSVETIRRIRAVTGGLRCCSTRSRAAGPRPSRRPNWTPWG